jgi:crotonobetainyl-CoA:carnitine CoA-transferase CaiB-like acyl-CoA transferase
MLPQLAPAIELSDTPGTITTAPPLLGQHSVEILHDFGFAEAEILSLRESGVIRQADLPRPSQPM